MNATKNKTKNKPGGEEVRGVSLRGRGPLHRRPRGYGPVRAMCVPYMYYICVYICWWTHYSELPRDTVGRSHPPTPLPFLLLNNQPANPPLTNTQTPHVMIMTAGYASTRAWTPRMSTSSWAPSPSPSGAWADTSPVSAQLSAIPTLFPPVLAYRIRGGPPPPFGVAIDDELLTHAKQTHLYEKTNRGQGPDRVPAAGQRRLHLPQLPLHRRLRPGKIHKIHMLSCRGHAATGWGS